MFRSVKQIGTIFCWCIVVMAVITIFVAATFVGNVNAREAPKNPYIQPGDGDGPAGVCEVIPVNSWSQDAEPRIVGPVNSKRMTISVYFIVQRAILEFQCLTKAP